MKKHILILILCLLIAAGMCLLVSLPGPSSHFGLPQITGTSPTQPTQNGTGGNGSSGTGNGSKPTQPLIPTEVRLYICPQEEAAVYETLAQTYTDTTGIPCYILSGNLEALMATEAPPTIFCIHSQAEAERWYDSMQDLSGQPVFEQLYNPAFALTVEGKPLALSMDVTAYGIIYNAQLLSMAGYTRDDFTDFSSFQQKVDAVTEKKNILGAAAFCQPNLADSNLVSLLVGGTEDAQQLRALLDQILANDAPSSNATESFIAQQTVFYIGGAWEYDALAALGFNKLDILPFFTDKGGNLPCVSHAYWGVNRQAAAQDVQASLDFWLWAVTKQDAAAPVDSLGLIAPFREAEAGDLFMRRLVRKYMAAEAATVCWEIAPGMTEAVLSQLMPLLEAYAAAPNDENWDPIAQLLTP